MRKVTFVLLPLIVIGLAAGYFVFSRERGSDSDQITAMIERGRQGIERKSLNTAASCLSKSYSDQYGMNYDRIRVWAAQAFRAETSYEVAVDAPQVTVQGDQAQARTHVVVSTVASGDRQQVFSGDVLLRLRKERVRRYLIFPAREWKVISMEGIGDVLDFGH